MAKYYGFWQANSRNTCNRVGYESNNLRECISTARSIAEANRFANGDCRWYVNDGQGRTVAEGGMTQTGRRWRTHDLRWVNLN